MKKKIFIFIVGLLLVGSNVFADDVEIDENGNVTTGVSSSANLEVTGGSAEKAIVGNGFDTGGTGVYGENKTGANTNYGYLGHDQYGVYGLGIPWAGYFDGDVWVTGSLTAGTITGYTETDPVFSAHPSFGITGGQISNWDAAYGWGDHSLGGYDTTNDSWTGTGDIYTTSGRVGIGITNPQAGLHVSNDVVIDQNSTGLRLGETNIGSGYTQIMYDNASGAIGTPSVTFKFNPKNNQNTGTTNFANIIMKKYYGSNDSLISFATRTDTESITEKMRITAEGNVGIGTTNPSTKLDVRGHIITGVDGSGGSLVLASADAVNEGGEIGWHGAASHSDWHQDIYADKMRFWSDTLGGDNLVLDDGGNIGIGTADPGEKLTVAGTIESTSGGIKFPDGTVQMTAAAPTWHQVLPAAERFMLVMGGEAVLDKETGLVWEKSPYTATYSWKNSFLYCNGLNIGGRMGWHLPTIEQLASLVDPTQTNPSLPSGHPFTNVQSYYWSATTFVGDTTYALVVHFDNGFVNGVVKTVNAYQWCVRGGQSHDVY